MAEHRFHTPERAELEIKVPSGDIDVETIDGEETFISVEGDEKLVELTEIRQDGRRIVVELRTKKAFGITIAIGDFSFGGSSYRVRARVPHGSRADLSTAAADMRLRGRFEQLEVKSASGDLTLDGEVERDAILKTVSGDVRLERVHGELRLQTVSGDASVGYVGHSVVGKSVSGDMRLECVREGQVNMQSVSGDVEVGVPSGTNLDVDAGSVSGDLTSEVPLGSERGPGEDGPMLVVRGKTVSGDFRVVRGV